MRIGFIGVGNMGGPMVHNLLRAGHDVTAFDLVETLLDAVVDAGANRASDIAAVAAGAEVLITMLPASVHVETAYLGDSGILSCAAKETLLLDCSTIAPATAQRVAQAAVDAGFRMLDAPVSGGTGGAHAGTLTFIVGGDEDDLEIVRPLLEVMGANIFHAGKSGAGQVAKVCNNMLLAVQMTATAEALNLGAANGLDPQVLSAIMQKSSGGNWCLNVYNPWPGVMPDVPASKGYEGGFLVDLMIKDLELAMGAAAAQGASVSLGSLAHNLYKMHRSLGDAGRLDFSSILRLYNSSAG